MAWPCRSVVNALRLYNLFYVLSAAILVVRFESKAPELTRSTSLMHHCSSIAGRARVRYVCGVSSNVAKLGASDLVEHCYSQIIVQRT